MPAERYYFPYPLHEDTVIELEGTEFHHLSHVMRNRIGDAVEVVNGQGQLAQATVQNLSKKQATLALSSITTQDRKSKNPLILVQAIPRMNRLEFILEKSTELGVDEIWLLPAAHSEKKDLSEHQLQRLEILLIAAMKQCGRLWLPRLQAVKPLKTWQELPLPTFFGDTDLNAPPLLKVWQSTLPQAGVLFFVGPESGFSKEEVSRLKELGGHGVKLHENILRTDTAALTGLSLMSYWSLFGSA